MRLQLGRVWLALLVVGGAVAAIWISLAAGSATLEAFGGIQPAYVVLLLATTAFSVFVRFVRSQFLLRRVGFRLPTRRSLSVFLASLVGIATPAYAGETIRALLMRNAFGVPARATVTLLLAERLLDVATLGGLLALVADVMWIRLGMLVLLCAIWLVGVGGLRLARNAKVPGSVVAELSRPNTMAWAFSFSLASWLPTALLLGLASASLGLAVGPVDGLRVFSEATLFGGLTLMPAGIGSTGSVAILELQNLGISLVHSVLVVSLLRLATTGFAIAVGVCFMAIELWRQRIRPANAMLHFDEIAQEYAQQFSPHVWNHLLERKINLIASALPDATRTRVLGLDLGCGLGQQCVAMLKHGYRVIGLDAAHNLVQQAHDSGVMATTGQAPALPFRDDSFDFVYTVGVLHHLPPGNGQASAFSEAQRVLRPGGLLIVHESNPRNPLFRFYMGYVFPLLKTIDEGTECWIRPQRWASTEGMTLLTIRYFTFIPDFVPQRLMKPLLVLERRLEQSALRPYAAHYMAVLRKEVEPDDTLSSLGSALVSSVSSAAPH
jgi:SAM-dependent methyltransferase/uncharacterized membrane protein YbhN (UPF0104 family)